MRWIFASAAAIAVSANLALLAGAPLAHAQQAPAGAPAAPAAWLDTLKFSGHVEGGITFNPDDPTNGLNFGHLFTDRSNSPLLNQVLLTAERDVDPKATGYDFGFKLQGMYGSDARYTHFTGELDDVFRDRNQLDIVEANITAHLPLLTAGGIDAKIGQYPTPLGAEVIDASGNFFYSHSYIFNFGIPLKHTGFYTTTHVNDLLDIWAGADSGVNTSVGDGDNNDAWAGLGGFGLNLMGGNLTILGLAHIGPENPRTVPEHNSTVRQIYDVVATWKVNDKLTSTTEVNYIRDDFFHATAEGVATYLTYAINDMFSVGGRAEIFRDDQGFFVAAFPSSTDFVDVEEGIATPRPFSGGKTTYSELTFGVNFKPAGVPKMFDGFVIRPEVRWDQALATSGVHPFNSLTSDHQFTFAADFILPF